MIKNMFILDEIISAVAFDRLNLHFKSERDYKFWLRDYHRTFKLKQILNYYQLPFNFFNWGFYENLINKESISFDEIKAFVKLLKHRNKIYLSKETKSDLSLIKKAIELQWDFEHLSKQLSFDLSAENSPYYRFLLYEILYQEMINLHDFLEDIRLAEKISLMRNIDIHKKFVDAIGEHLMNKSKVDARLIDCYYTMDYLYRFIEDKEFEKYGNLVKLNII